MLAGLVQSPTNDDPITQPENAAEPAQPGAAADAHPRAHHRPGAGRHLGRSRSRSSRAPTRRTAASTPRSAASSATTSTSYLTGTLGIDPGRAGERRLDHPDDAAAATCSAPATRRVLNHVADGRPARRRPHRRAAGHRARAGDERQPPLRLLRTPTASRSTSTSQPAAGSGSTYKVFTAAAALVGGLRRELHAERAAALHVARSTSRTAARAAPRTSSATTTPATRRPTT